MKNTRSPKQVRVEDQWRMAAAGVTSLAHQRDYQKHYVIGVRTHGHFPTGLRLFPFKLITEKKLKGEYK